MSGTSVLSKSNANSRHAFWLAQGLSLLLLAGTATQTLTTFFLRMGAAQTLRGAMSDLSWTSPVVWQLVGFVLAQLTLHALYGSLIWGLALATRAAFKPFEELKGTVVLWFAFLTFGVILANAGLFPRSDAAGPYAELAIRELAGIPLFAVWWILAGLLITGALCRAAWLKRPILKAWWASGRGQARRAEVLGIFVLMIAGFWILSLPGKPDPRPNIIVIGVDSLRLQHLGMNGGTQTPRMDAFLQRADIFKDTLTPVARTFPAWVALLTGRSPRQTNAIYNLVRRPEVKTYPTIADRLRDEGYLTVFAMDEVRFANIDKSYGFTHTITPPIGATDFIVGRIGDLPLSNLIANTELGHLFVPHIHTNRGVAYLWQPETFTQRLQAELPTGKPLFLAVHLTSAHWPYYNAHSPSTEELFETGGDEGLYLEGLKTADAMVGDLLDFLKARGDLDNALVVLLSDHGEALSLPGDALVDFTQHKVTDLEVPVHILDIGHGQSVLSPAQYEVLLSFRRFQQGATKPEQRLFNAPTTLEDLAPTLLEFAGVDFHSREFFGRSLMPILQGTVEPDSLDDRIRFTETDLRAMVGSEAFVDEDKIAKRNSRFFAVDPETGWLYLRPSAYESVQRVKERAAFNQTHLLAALPAGLHHHQYLWLNRKTGEGKVLVKTPDTEEDPEVQRLWDALWGYFPGEMRPLIHVTPDKLEVLDKESEQVYGLFMGTAPKVEGFSKATSHETATETSETAKP
jgi:arylsulfatase A-like enzyme